MRNKGRFALRNFNARLIFLLTPLSEIFITEAISLMLI